MTYNKTSKFCSLSFNFNTEQKIPKFDFHIFVASKELDDEKYEFKTKGGRIFLLTLILGFVLNKIGVINIGIWPLCGIAFGFCCLWNFITFGVFHLKTRHLSEKFEKMKNEYMKEEESPLAYWISRKKNDGEEGAITGDLSGTPIIWAASNLPCLEYLKDFLDKQLNAKEHVLTLSYVPMSLGKTIDMMKEYPNRKLLIVHSMAENELGEYSLATLEALTDILIESNNNRAFVPDWILDARENTDGKYTPKTRTISREEWLKNRAILVENEHVLFATFDQRFLQMKNDGKIYACAFEDAASLPEHLKYFGLDIDISKIEWIDANFTYIEAALEANEYDGILYCLKDTQSYLYFSKDELMKMKSEIQNNADKRTKNQIEKLLKAPSVVFVYDADFYEKNKELRALLLNKSLAIFNDPMEASEILTNMGMMEKISDWKFKYMTLAQLLELLKDFEYESLAYCSDKENYVRLSVDRFSELLKEK